MLDADRVLFDGVTGAIRKAKQMNGDPGDYEIIPGSRLDADLAMDSLDHVAMLVAIEEEFGVIASDEDFALGSVTTVEDVMDVVRRLADVPRH